MAKKIKKISKKFIALICMFVLTFSYSVIDNTDAATVTSRKDTLSDSRPTETSSHDVQFVTADTIDASETIVVDFGGGSDVFDLTDVVLLDIDLEVTGTDRTLTDTGCAANGFDAVIDDTPDTITFTYCAGSAQIASGTTINIKVGSNADDPSAGTDHIDNPAAGVYDVTIAGTFQTVQVTSTMKVAIVAGVTVSATVSESLSFAHIGLIAGSCTGDTGTIDSTINTSGDPDTVPFGTLGSDFTVACQQLTVGTNAASGYTVTQQETDQLTYGGSTILDTVCDATACPNHDSNAAAWTDASTASGFGHGCEKVSGDGVVCDAAYGVWVTNKYYRKFASIADAEAAQTLMSYTAGAPTADGVAKVHYKIKAASTQAAGAYGNVVVYIATPTF